MLTLTGVVKGAQEIGGGKKKTGEIIPVRSVVQIEGQDQRGLFVLFTLTVPDYREYEDQQGQVVNVPVRAWASGATVNLVYAGGE